MSDAKPVGKKLTVKQYYGPNRRHPEACVELSFALPDRRFSLSGLADALRGAGYALEGKDAGRDLSLPEAIGILGAAVLANPMPPRWSWGVAGATGWICMSHYAPLDTAHALVRCHAAIVRGGTQEALDALLHRLPQWWPTRKIDALLMEAAAELGLAVMMTSRRAAIFQLGSGKQGKQFLEMAGENDSITGQAVAKEKLSTVEMLVRAGLPTTRAVPLRAIDDPLEIARRVGFPCVVKPRNMGKGQGVTARIASERHLAEAIEHAARVAEYPLLIENHVEGFDHRMTLADGKLLWVYRRTPPFVIGDGQASILQLIAAENGRRTGIDEDQRGYLQDIAVDSRLTVFLGDNYHMTPQSVPGEGQRIDLGGEANVAGGGVLEDVTGQVHPDNARMAVRVARLFRMGSLGIDFMTPDISRSWKDVPSAIIEVNAAPGISGRGDASLAVRTMFPFRLSGRIPVFVVIGDEGYRDRTERCLLGALSRRGVATGHCAFRAGGEEISAVSPLHSVGSPDVETVLLDPEVEAAVFSSSLRHIEALGFPFGPCDVILAAGTELPPYVTRQAGRLVVHSLDPDGIASLVDEAIAPYRDGGSGGTRPVVELIEAEGTDDRGQATLRCWRVRALPRAPFLERLAGLGADAADTSAVGLIASGDIVDAVRRLGRMYMKEAGPGSGDVGFGHAAPAFSWNAPCVDIPVFIAGEDRRAALKALALATDTVNALIGGLG